MTELLQWLGRHQPVMPFPLILPLVGAWWVTMAARWISAPPESDQEKTSGYIAISGLVATGLAWTAGLLTGHWYFMVPLGFGVLGGVLGGAVKAAWDMLQGTTVLNEFTVESEQPPQKPLDAKRVIKECTRIVDEYRKTVPTDLLTIEAWERADARLRALRGLFELLERLERTDRLEHTELDVLVTKADALFRDVPIEQSLIERYRADRVELGPTIRSVKMAIEHLYLSILNLPSEAKATAVDEVPLEYRRLLDPDDHAAVAAGVLPDITIPERPEPPRMPHRPRLVA